MKRLCTSRVAAPFLAAGIVAASVGMATPAIAHDRLTVEAGESIQAAIDAARPGDTIKVRAGTYGENLIVTKDRIKIEGAGAGKTILEPPGVFVPNICNPPDMGGTGICVADATAPSDQHGAPTINHVVQRFELEDFTVQGFQIGVFLFGTNRSELEHNEFANNEQYGAFSNTSTRSEIQNNVAHGSAEAGFYVGDSPDSRAEVEKNEAYDNALGFFFRDASNGDATRNYAHDNCVGFLLLDTGATVTVPTDWKLDHNRSNHNNKVCAANEEAPPLSGVGIALAGASNNRITANEVNDNVPAGDSPFIAGGIVLVSSAEFGGGIPSNNKIRQNHLKGNLPYDISDAGQNNSFRNNNCNSSQPGGLCN